MIKIMDVYKNGMKDERYRYEYVALEEEFRMMAAIAKRRCRAGFS